MNKTFIISGNSYSLSISSKFFNLLFDIKRIFSFMAGAKPSSFSIILYDNHNSLRVYPISSNPEIFLIKFLERDKISRFLRFGKFIILSILFEDKHNCLHFAKVFKTGASIFSIEGIIKTSLITSASAGLSFG